MKNKAICPFCNKPIDFGSRDMQFVARKACKVRPAMKQYFHKSCYQDFYSVRGVIYDRTKKSTKSSGTAC